METRPHRPNVFPCRDLCEFMNAFRCGHFDDPRSGEEHPDWPDHECDGRDPNPLLVAPGDWRDQGPVLVSGEIRDGKGHHPAATFLGGAHCRLADEQRRGAATPEQRRPTPAKPGALGALREAAKLLRRLRWSLLQVAANEATGFVRVVAESRDWISREGVQVLLLRSSFGSTVLEERSRVLLRDGMFTSEWEVADHLGRRRFNDLSSACAEMLRYACDNDAHGALSLAEAEGRHAQLAPLIRALA